MAVQLPQELHDWAKTHDGHPGISVRQHLLTVAFIAEQLLRRFPLFCQQNRISPEAVLFLAAAHDVGKFSLDFLQQSEDWLVLTGLLTAARQGGWKSRFIRKHGLITQKSLQYFLAGMKVPHAGAALWGAVVGAHHGRIMDSFSSRPPRLNADESVLEDRRQCCLGELWTRFGSPRFPDAERDAALPWCTGGLITLADWIGSDERFFPADESPGEPELRRRAEEAVSILGLGMPAVLPALTFSDMFDGRTPYPLQSMAAAFISGPGTFIVEAPMGMGKTEAALFAAYRLLASGKSNGIYFALPTQATSNRMFLRLAAFVNRICPETQPVQLIHGNSWLEEELKALVLPASSAGQADCFWFSTAKRALFAPFGVGTIDQALLSVLAVKHFPLRRFALAGKTVILDEVHTYDIYTGTLIRYLCEELEKLGCTVIILSATLTEAVRESLLGLPASGETDSAPYPRLSGRSGGLLEPVCPPSPPDRLYRIRHSSKDAALAEALTLATAGAQVLWVCDTVGSAQETFLSLRSKAVALPDSPEIGLLHSRFPFYLRERLEKRWMERFGAAGERQHGAILVSTQIVEQSVDLDADALFSELAPTDMMLQRMGRLWRHPRSSRPVDRPVFTLISETECCDTLREMGKQQILTVLGDKAVVYHPYVLLRTLEQWEGLDCLPLPSGIRELMAKTYRDEPVPAGWEPFYEKQYGQRLSEQTLAGMNTDIWQMSLNDNIPTRLSDGDYVFVLCTSGGETVELPGQGSVRPGGDFSLSVARKLHRNTVRLSARWFSGRPDDRLLEPYHIDGCAVIQGKEVIVPLLKPGKRLWWDEELGLALGKEER